MVSWGAHHLYIVKHWYNSNMDVEIGLLALGVPISNDTTHNISGIGPVSAKLGKQERMEIVT